MLDPGATQANVVHIGTGRMMRRSTLAFLPLPVLGAPIDSFVRDADHVPAFIFSGVVLLFVWLMVFRPALEIGDASLRVVNVLRNRTIHRDDISEFHASYHGLEITDRSGKRITTAMAVARTNWSSARGTESRAVVIERALVEWLSGDADAGRSLPQSLR